MLSRTLVTRAFTCIILLLFNVYFYSWIFRSIYDDFFLYIFICWAVSRHQLWHVASLQHADSVVEARGLWITRAPWLPCMGFVASRARGILVPDQDRTLVPALQDVFLYLTWESPFYDF